MAVVATGSLADRPIGRTFATVAQRRFSGELAITSTGKLWTIVWRDGYVVGATGTHPADSAVKVALGAGLVNSSKASEILGALAKSPKADDVAIVAEVGKLAPEHVTRLRRRVVANRAMRLFSLEGGQFVLDTDMSSAPPPDMVPIDPRVILYQGAMAHLTDDRYRRELGALGDAFQLRDDAAGSLDTFGFGDGEAPVIAAITGRALTPTALVQAAPDVDPRMTMAVIYALAMWGYAEPIGPRTSGVFTIPTIPPTTQPATTTVTPPTIPATAAPARTARGTRSATTRTRANAITDGVAIRALVAERMRAIDAKADHYALLGVSPEAPPDRIRAAYFDVARQLHPDRITAVGLEDVRAEAQRVFAQINAAFGVLSNPKKRAEYAQILDAGGEAALRQREDAAADAAERLLAAEEHIQAAEIALRRQMFPQAAAAAKIALDLNPDEGEHHAVWAWATWCATSTVDRPNIVAEVRAALEHAIKLTPNNVSGYFYLGRVMRADGHDHEAQAWLKKALAVSPGHAEASAELRIVELRLKDRHKPPTQPPPTAPAPTPGPDDDKKKPGGLFGRFKR